MAVSGFLFISWRIFQLVLLIPIVGMLSWFVHGYVESNQLTPNFILVLFIVSVLALAWCFATLFNYLRARHDAFFVALIDLGFVGALIGGIVTLRGISNANCSSFSSGSLYVDLGPFGYYGRQSNSPWSVNVNKTCAMLKASWALAIIATLTFFVTFVSLISRKEPPAQNSPLTSFRSSSPSSSTATTKTTTKWWSSASTTLLVTATAAQPVAAVVPAVAAAVRTMTSPAHAARAAAGASRGAANTMSRGRRMHEAERKKNQDQITKKTWTYLFFGHCYEGMRRLPLDAPSCIKTTRIPPLHDRLREMNDHTSFIGKNMIETKAVSSSNYTPPPN
jgi:hypothetical protein